MCKMKEEFAARLARIHALLTDAAAWIESAQQAVEVDRYGRSNGYLYMVEDKVHQLSEVDFHALRSTNAAVKAAQEMIALSKRQDAPL